MFVDFHIVVVAVVAIVTAVVVVAVQTGSPPR